MRNENTVSKELTYPENLKRTASWLELCALYA